MWKPLEFNGKVFTKYLASDEGQICVRKKWKPNVGRLRLVKQHLHSSGYLYVNLRHEGKQYFAYVHRIIGCTFLGEQQEGMEINHKDLNKYNNNISNLEWNTHAENIAHAKANGRFEGKAPRTLTDSHREYIKTHYAKGKRGFGTAQIAKKLNITRSSVCYIVRKYGLSA